MAVREVGYNSQRDNFVVKGIPGSSQCFATSAWMFICYYIKSFRFDDDAGLKAYVARLTAKSADMEYEWAAHRALIQAYFDEAGVKGKVVLGIDLNTGIGTVSPEKLHELLIRGPVIVGTKKMAGLPGGHIILAVDNVEDSNDSELFHDSYGDANSHYMNQNGANVEYKISLLDAKYPCGPIRAMWFEQAS